MPSEIINITVVQKTIANEKKRFVNARELHQWLKVGRRFATWITERISKYDFVENLDYFITIPEFGNGLKAQKSGKIVDAKTGKVLQKEYILSIDMAKELAMLENNDIGKKVRKYFIRTEAQFKEVMTLALKNPKFINQITEGFRETREETKGYRKNFTDSIKDYVAIKKYGTYTDMLYGFLFRERAKEYKELLNLAKNDLTRNTMYEEVLLIIGAFEEGLSKEVAKESKKLGRLLTENEFKKVFNEYASAGHWAVYQKRARKILATYDEELRGIKHAKLIDYKKEFTQEDIQKLIGR